VECEVDKNGFRVYPNKVIKGDYKLTWYFWNL
jgi:hypothetical protein